MKQLVSRTQLVNYAWRGGWSVSGGTLALLLRSAVHRLPLVGGVLNVVGWIAGVGLLAAGGWSLARFAVQMWRRV
jgi:CHASE2 domain-containing sensor protein